MVLNDLLEKPDLEGELGLLVVVGGLGALSGVAGATEGTLLGAVRS